MNSLTMAPAMTLERPTVILFDMDGTTVRHVNPKLLQLLEVLDSILYKISSFFSNKDPDKLPLQAPSHKRPKLLVHRTMHKIRRKPVDQIVEPCPGIRALLNLIKEHQIPTAVVSNGLGEGYGYDILEKFDLDQYFNGKVFREDIQISKPHPDPILKAIEATGHKITKQDVVWYIGDNRKDITAAIAAMAHLPCKIQPISYGMKANLGILEHNISRDHIITTYYEFTAKLRALLSGS